MGIGKLMYFKIHRGTKEIGGSCVEVWTENTRILLDFGMPLVDKAGNEFDFGKYKTLDLPELIKQNVLPDINGLYKDDNNLIAGVVISHPHQDHYGLSNFIDKNVKYYLGEATHKIIELNNIFTPQNVIISNVTYFEKSKPFKIGDFTITPYWMDHSAFDSYSFLVEASGKSIFYSGDFRKHGRKTKAFFWFTHNAPSNVDYLLLEGTNIGKESKIAKTETEIEKELVNIFSQQDKINLVYTSGQNIDRIVSVFKACIQTNKILVVDIYVGTILKELSRFAKIPYPSKSFVNVKVIFPEYLSKHLKNFGYENILSGLKEFEINTSEISTNFKNIVMLVRPSMKKELENIKTIDNGNFIYSMWEGYFEKPSCKKFINYLENRNFSIHHIHTSGHADTETLKQMVNAITPKNIVPIHTFNGNQYSGLFSVPIVVIEDGEIREV